MLQGLGGFEVSGLGVGGPRGLRAFECISSDSAIDAEAGCEWGLGLIGFKVFGLYRVSRVYRVYRVERVYSL